MSEWRFHTPGWVDADELPQEVHDAWHAWHTKRAKLNLAEMVALLPDGVDPGLVPYVDPTCGGVPDEGRTPTPIDWEGFPERVKTRFGPNALREVEHRGIEDLTDEQAEFAVVDSNDRPVDHEHWSVRDRQDEYLEWHAREDHDGVLRSVTFVCEGYDYYSFLFSHPLGRPRVLDRYRECTGDDSIEAGDLMAPSDMILVQPGRRPTLLARKGEFNPRNRYNQRAGIVHLSHAANSLGAEVRLAVTSALPRIDANGERVDGTDDKKLMCCTTGGEPGRSSDPKIAAGAYRQVNDPETPRRFTLTDPIGLYIKTWQYESLQYPEGQPTPRGWWQVLRGEDATDPSDPSDARVLRLHLEVPKGEKYRLGELLVDGEPLKHPAQLADLIKMHLIADVWDVSAGAPAISCEGGCCRTNGLLEIYRDEPKCGPGGVDAFPGLIVPTQPPATTQGNGAPAPIALSRRPM